MTTLRVLVLLTLAAAAAACGQKGPLVLPDAQHPRKKVRFPTLPQSTTPTTHEAPAAPSAPTSTPDPGPQA